MKRIEKGREPKELTKFRLRSGDPAPSYAAVEFPGAVVRARLFTDQGESCCYCERRISGPKAVRIEHFRGQSAHPEIQLTWGNLWAVCEGGEGADPESQHCDRFKGGRECDLDPGSVIDAEFSWSAGGTISHARSDHVETVLNLNVAHLVHNRKQALHGFVKALAAGRSGPFAEPTLQRALDKLDERPPPPFAGMLRHHLRRKIRSVQA